MALLLGSPPPRRSDRPQIDFIVVGPSTAGKSTLARCLVLDQIDPTTFIPVFRRNLLEMVQCLLIFQSQLASSDPSFSSSLTPDAIDFLLAVDPVHPAAWSTPGLNQTSRSTLTRCRSFDQTVKILSSSH
eukprot:GABV01013559.1.p1 GENE.GABV01013559.1~~GABV01013559.1.p1  ORF type:complete len:130 (-),score=43.79 GABV01013559.1:11-400(-)